MVACAVFVNLQLQIIALERDERNRAEFRRFTSQFQPGQFLFVDESSKDERILLRCAAKIAIDIKIVRFSETSCHFYVGLHHGKFSSGM